MIPDFEGIQVDAYNQHAESRGYAKFRGAVISIHGMNTRGKWQKDVSLPLQVGLLAHEAIDYGTVRLGVVRPVGKCEEILPEIKQAYERLKRLHSNIGVIAHSFGTRIIGHAMEVSEELQFRNVILTGAVLPTNFDWDFLEGRQQVVRVLNEYDEEDPVCRLVPKMMGYGKAGVLGFDESVSRIVTNSRIPKKGHSHSMDKMHATRVWVPFLRQED